MYATIVAMLLYVPTCKQTATVLNRNTHNCGRNINSFGICGKLLLITRKTIVHNLMCKLANQVLLCVQFVSKVMNNCNDGTVTYHLFLLQFSPILIIFFFKKQ